MRIIGEEEPRGDMVTSSEDFLKKVRLILWRIDKEFWAYDITSVSSYSESLSQVQWGNNKEDDRLPQLNLALVFGETSNSPFITVS